MAWNMVWSGTLVWMTKVKCFYYNYSCVLGMNHDLSPTETWVAWLKVLELFEIVCFEKLFSKYVLDHFLSEACLLSFFLQLIMLLSRMNAGATKESVSNEPNIVRIYFSWTSEQNSTIKLDSSFIVIQNLFFKLLHHVWYPQCILPGN